MKALLATALVTAALGAPTAVAQAETPISRVLLVNLGTDSNGVQLQIASEQTNARPAPPRNGSALAAE